MTKGLPNKTLMPNVNVNVSHTKDFKDMVKEEGNILVI